MHVEYITFFHNSDCNFEEVPTLLNPAQREVNKGKRFRPAFYWFCDRWHTYMLGGEEYFYLFVKNPRKEKIRFRSRHAGGEFDGLYNYYKRYSRKREEVGIWAVDSYKGYLEPAILMSYSKVVPDLAVRFTDLETREGVIFKPDKYKGKKIRFLDENYVPRKFTEIDPITEIVPEIKESLPFVKPDFIDGKYIYKNWLPVLGELFEKKLEDFNK